MGLPPKPRNPRNYKKIKKITQECLTVSGGSYRNFLRCYALVAQSVECILGKDEVSSSILLKGSTKVTGYCLGSDPFSFVRMNLSTFPISGNGSTAMRFWALSTC